MKNKIIGNKGSTLVLLVVAIGVISLLGTSVLGVTMMNYKIKKANTEIKDAFYRSEAGLDETYSNTYAFVQDAVKDSNGDANNFIGAFRLDNMDYLKNNSPYNLCIITNIEYDDEGTPIGVTYTFDEDEIQKQAEKIFNHNYKLYLDGKIASLNNLDILDNPKITVTDKGWNYNSADDLYTKLSLAVDSEYANDDNIQKKTSVNLTIDAPEYNEPYTVVTKIIPVNPFWTMVLTADDLNINGNSEFEGDVHISGDMNVEDDNINTSFKGDLTVNGDMNLDGNSSITNVKNVYTNNIYLNGNSTTFETIGTGNKIYVKDDLELNNPNQKILIDGSYYGFSDGTYNPAPDNSSGININESSGLDIVVTEDLYLYGTSYVKINDTLKYQTGESVSVKGNYRAYMQPLTFASAVSSDGKDLRNVEFADYDFLRLADHFSDGSNFTAMHKAAYINYYNEEYGGLTIPLGIDLNVNRIHSIGSTINEGNLEEATIAFEDYAAFTKAEDVYDIQTTKLGYEKDHEGNDLGDVNFLEEVKLGNIPADIENSLTASKYVYIDDGTGTFTLPSGNYSGVIITNKNLIISDNVIFKGLIITNGNMTVSGDFDFEGALIVGGNVNLSNTGDKTFKHNKDVVSKIVAEYDLHKTIFKDSASISTIKVTTFVAGDVIDDETINVDFSRLLKFNSWQMK